MVRELEYTQVDVFAEARFTGNSLGIFSDARGLTDGEMQALARETNLSETTFILPREASVETAAGVRVRIFTVQEELPFAGHPTLGTASWLYWHHPELRGTRQIVLDLAAGRVPVTFAPRDGTPGVFATMQQPRAAFGAMHDPDRVAAAIGLTVDDLDSTLPIQTVATGIPFCIVPLRSVETAGRLKIPQGPAQAYLKSSDAKFFYCIARLTGERATADWHARMQFYNGEDPATGSAAGCAIAYMVRHGLAASGEQMIVEQESRCCDQAKFMWPPQPRAKCSLEGAPFPWHRDAFS